MLSQIRPAIVSFLTLTVITGVIYPAVVTGIAKVAFKARSPSGDSSNKTAIRLYTAAPRYI